MIGGTSCALLGAHLFISPTYSRGIYFKDPFISQITISNLLIIKSILTKGAFKTNEHTCTYCIVLICSVFCLSIVALITGSQC